MKRIGSLYKVILCSGCAVILNMPGGLLAETVNPGGKQNPNVLQAAQPESQPAAMDGAESKGEEAGKVTWVITFDTKKRITVVSPPESDDVKFDGGIKFLIEGPGSILAIGTDQVHRMSAQGEKTALFGSPNPAPQPVTAVDTGASAATGTGTPTAVATTETSLPSPDTTSPPTLGPAKESTATAPAGGGSATAKSGATAGKVETGVGMVTLGGKQAEEIPVVKLGGEAAVGGAGGAGALGGGGKIGEGGGIKKVGPPVGQ